MHPSCLPQPTFSFAGILRRIFISSIGFCSLALAIQSVHAATVVDVDATGLLLADGVTVDNIANPGSAGAFTAADGSPPLTLSHPANDNPGVSIQGLNFSAGNMNAAQSSASVGLAGANEYTVRAWVWNPDIAAEEAIISWGRRGGGDGTNAGFHQGTNGTFGAIGHWGGPDVSWGNDGTDIVATANRWAQLSWVYDGLTDSVYIDGVLSNSKDNLLDVWDVYDDGVTPGNVVMGSESNADGAGTPIAFSGTIGRVQVFDTAMSDAEILAAFNTEKILFFDGVTDITDTDNDGIPDEVEDMHLCMDKLVPDADADPDMDDLSNAEELAMGTDPCDDDSDDDNVNDGDEVNRMVGGEAAPTDPLDPDTDDDGLTDDVETDTGINNGADDTGTDPLVADGDGDGRLDGEEFEDPVTDPFDPDSDDDGANDALEVLAGTDPNDPSSKPGGVLIDAGNVLIDVNAGNLDVGSAPATLPNTGMVVGDFDLVNQDGMPVPVIESITDPNDVTLSGIHINREEHFQNVYVGPTTPDSLTVPDGSRSIEVWGLNPEQEHGEEMMVGWGRRGGGDGTNMSFGWTDQGSFGAVGHWGGGPDVPWGVAGIARPPLGEWRHLVYTYDGTDTRLYDNGTLAYTEATGSLDTHDGFPFIIGGQSAADAPHDPTVNGVGAGSFGGNFRGLISRVRIHDDVLPDAAVINNFLTGPGAASGIGFRITSLVRDPTTEFVTVTWTSRSGRSYKVESSVDMTSWTELDDNVPGSDEETTSFTDSDENPVGTLRRFYRVSLNPLTPP